MNSDHGFSQKGYSFIKQFAPADLLRSFEDSIEKLFMENCPNVNDIFEATVFLNQYDKNKLYQLYLMIPKMREFSQIREHFFKHIEKVIPNKNYIDVGSGVLFGLPEDQRLTWNWHQECNYHPGLDEIIHYWMPLYNPSSRTNGAMSVLEGTHLLGSLEYDIFKPHVDGGTSLIPRNIKELEKSKVEVFFELNPGDTAYFDKNLIHKSNYNLSGKTRFTAVFRLAAIKEVPENHDFSSIVTARK